MEDTENSDEQCLSKKGPFESRDDETGTDEENSESNDNKEHQDDEPMEDSENADEQCFSKRRSFVSRNDANEPIDTSCVEVSRNSRGHTKEVLKILHSNEKKENTYIYSIHTYIHIN